MEVSRRGPLGREVRRRDRASPDARGRRNLDRRPRIAIERAENLMIQSRTGYFLKRSHHDGLRLVRVTEGVGSVNVKVTGAVGLTRKSIVLF